MRVGHSFHRWCLLGLVAHVAAAQPSLFSDGFDRPTAALQPGPGWSGISLDSATTLTLEPEAAHRGDAGLRLRDMITTLGHQTAIYRSDFASDICTSLSNNRYIRFWLRVSPTPSSSQSLHLYRFGTNDTLRQQQEMRVEDNRAVSAGFQKDGGIHDDATSFAPGWHLIEHSFEGLCTVDGSRLLFMDGRPISPNEPTEFSWPKFIDYFELGTHSASPDWVGTIDYDDFRVSDTAPASTFRFAAAKVAGTAGACNRLSLELADSTGRPVVTVPTRLEPLFSTDGGVPLTFFSDSRCQNAVQRTVIEEGTQAAFSVYFEGELGSGALTVSDIDLLPATIAFTVSEAEAPSALAVGCGCMSSQGVPLLCALFLLQRRRLRSS